MTIMRSKLPVRTISLISMPSLVSIHDILKRSVINTRIGRVFFLPPSLSVHSLCPLECSWSRKKEERQGDKVFDSIPKRVNWHCKVHYYRHILSTVIRSPGVEHILIFCFGLFSGLAMLTCTANESSYGVQRMLWWDASPFFCCILTSTHHRSRLFPRAYLMYVWHRDRAYEAFLLEYAKMEDHIRALWVKVMKTFQPYIVSGNNFYWSVHVSLLRKDQAQEQINTEKEVEKLREKEQNLGLRYHKKGNEGTSSLFPSFFVVMD